jgi:hypothetical protein
MDTLERETLEIEKFESADEINNYCNKLIDDLVKMKERKKKGYDVSSDLHDLKFKITLLSEANQRIREIETKPGIFNF